MLEMDDHTSEVLKKIGHSIPRKMVTDAMGGKDGPAHEWLEAKVRKAIRTGQIPEHKPDAFEKRMLDRRK